MNYGKELKKIRIEEGLTQEEVAIFSGIARTNYINIENGTKKASFYMFLKILNSIGYDLEIKIFKKSEKKIKKV